jgi:hypothetical protein
LWQRNGAFYARLDIADDAGRKETRRVRLEATSVPEAQKELFRLRDQRDENALPALRRTPKLEDYTASYFQFLAQVKDCKRESTIGKERCALKKWNVHIGHLRLDKIRPLHINSYVAQRKSQGRSARTVNLDVIMLRNVLKKAREDGLIKALPIAGMSPLKVSTVKRELVPMADIERICEKGSFLILDEVRLSGGRDEEQMLFDLVSYRHEYFLPTVFTTNVPAASIETELGSRSVDRMREAAFATLGFDWASKRSEYNSNYGQPR